MSCQLDMSNEQTRPRKDVVINFVYNFIYKTAMFARHILKKINKQYKSNEIHK